MVKENSVNFFRQMRNVSAFLETVCRSFNRTSFDEYRQEVFANLVRFVTVGLPNRSQLTKIICSNWSVPNSQLGKIIGVAMGKVYSTKVICNTVRKVSVQFTILFPFPLEDAFGSLTREADKKLLDYINSVCVSLGAYNSEEEVLSGNVVISEVISSVSEITKFGKYNLADCQTELRAIKLLSNSSVYNYLDDCNKEKMAYILNRLNQPLLIRQKGSNIKTLNSEKIDILLALNQIEVPALVNLAGQDKVSTLLSDVQGNAMFENIVAETDSSESSVSSDDIEVEELGVADANTLVEEPVGIGESGVVENTPNRLQISRNFYENVLRPLLEKQVNANKTVDKSNRESASKRCTEWFRLLCPDQIEKAVSSLPSDMVASLVENLDSRLLIENL